MDWRQTEILTDRYFAVVRGRLGSLLLFLLQGPLIAGMIVMVWRGSSVDPRLELFMCLAAVWVGCMNACREIVAERPIYRRERSVFLSIPSYMLSKVFILSVIDALQVIALIWIVHKWVGLEGNKLLLFGALFLGALMGTLLGLTISAFVSSPDKAVTMVPLAILPQILLSKPFAPGGSFQGAVAVAEKCMPLRWDHELYVEVVRLPKDGSWWEVLQAGGACLAIVVALYFLACLVLWIWDE